ncbi:Carbohydrate binding family 6 [Cordyceps fumosorosea ARSEF 2679]|uniref:Carbohydrate binding family 6 n=1 Tax=Cordyceps fumosorosea (strain ARSEF 2679) TaxID=1081104 RepID=A0A168E3T7_CORFA|nr:Carbohydrate binding family 6 [Cordyceps fumosorosea ARSEF 2679]OAA73341.1 Carbohydrate binding family 6 [Cordyceps fumosorosea ARSEF 2679]
MALRTLTAVTAFLASRVHANAADNGVQGVPLPAGFSRALFYDDFSSNGTLDLTKWKHDLGTQYPGGPANWGTGEIQSYTASPDNIYVTRERTLRIIPVHDGQGGWTSARVETLPDWDFGAAVGQQVRVEARIKLGQAAADEQWGIWPAFWSLGSAYRDDYQNWPSVGEVDFFESTHGQPAVWQSLHCGPAPAGGPCNEPVGRFQEAGDDIYDRDEWNVFSWELDRRRGTGATDAELGKGERMTWFVNDKPLFVLGQSDIGSDEVWGQLVDSKKFLLLNVAVGGSFANARAGFETPTNTTAGGLGAAMEVDYVGVYEAWSK